MLTIKHQFFIHANSVGQQLILLRILELKTDGFFVQFGVARQLKRIKLNWTQDQQANILWRLFL